MFKFTVTVIASRVTAALLNSDSGAMRHISPYRDDFKSGTRSHIVEIDERSKRAGHLEETLLKLDRLDPSWDGMCVTSGKREMVKVARCIPNLASFTKFCKIVSNLQNLVKM